MGDEKTTEQEQDSKQVQELKALHKAKKEELIAYHQKLREDITSKYQSNNSRLGYGPSAAKIKLKKEYNKAISDSIDIERKELSKLEWAQYNELISLVQKEQDRQSMEVAQGEKIEFLVFSGGGNKGAGYSGVYQGLKDGGVLNDIKAVAGSSAGAIIASMIATGVKAEEFVKISKATDFAKLLGEGMISHTGEPMRKMVGETVTSGFKVYLDGQSSTLQDLCEKRLTEIESKLKDPGIMGQEMENLLKMKDRILQYYNDKEVMEDFLVRTTTKEDGEITFKDLAFMNALDPIRFKLLLVTAVKKRTGELIIFNEEGSPDVKIADAVRASAAFPIIFKPFVIDGEEYVDGGYRNNTPLDIPIKYYNGKQVGSDITLQTKSNGRTLCYAFDVKFGNRAFAAVWGNAISNKIVHFSNILRFILDTVFKKIVGVKGEFKFTEDQNKMYGKVRDNALNTIVLNTGDVGTLSFSAATRNFEYLRVKGYLQTAMHLNNHELNAAPDDTLMYKNFMLEVFEDDLKKRGVKVNWQTIAFCDSGENDKWKNREPAEVFKEFIGTILKEGNMSRISVKAPCIQSLIIALNSSETPFTIKEDFIKLLGIDTKEEIRDFKFNNSYFSSYLHEIDNETTPSVQR